MKYIKKIHKEIYFRYFYFYTAYMILNHNHIISYNILYNKIRLRSHGCAKWFHQIVVKA